MTYLTSTKTEYHRYYTAMRGVDLSGDGSRIDKSRFASLVNMWRDYDGVGAALTESVPGFRRIASLGGKCHALHRQRADGKDYLLVHAGTSLYRLPAEERDSLTAQSPIATLADERSVSFPAGSALFLLDGKKLLRVSKTGEAQAVGEGTGELFPYVPTTFINGKPYEQRNLLTRKFKERYAITDPKNNAYGSPNLAYTVIDEENALCELSGSTGGGLTEMYVPRTVDLHGKSYRVIRVADGAFRGLVSLTGVHIPVGVLAIGEHAFSGCTSLGEVFLPDELAEIGAEAFRGCTSLTSLWLGRSLCTVGKDAFDGCPTLHIRYPLGLSEYQKIEGAPSAESHTVTTLTYDTSLVLRIPLCESATEVKVSAVGGEELSAEALTENGRITALRITVQKQALLTGAELLIEGTLSAGVSAKSDTADSFLSEAITEDGGFSAIVGCRVAEVFDGRVFLSGNPSYPNTVFYSARNDTGQNDPTYFGVLNYFNDGVGPYPVGTLLSVGDTLAVFKTGDDGNGSIYYHTPKETEISLLPKIYPVSYVHSGTAVTGEAISFLDDPLFVGEKGICALAKDALSAQRSISCRSHAVNARLLGEELSSASLAVFCGYLAVLTEGRIYLADSRATYRHETGEIGYEWYYLEGIGTHTEDERVYRFAPLAHEGYLVKDTPDAEAHGTVYSETLESGESVFFLKEGEASYEVYPTEEFRGGVFHPAKRLCAIGDLLFFGCENGDICLFNNDKRGVPPKHIREAEDFDPSLYASRYGRVIHPCFYDFDRHAPHYELVYPLDDCGVPHLEKDTVKSSLVIKCQSYASSALSLTVATDRHISRCERTLPSGSLSFSDLDFSALALSEADTFTAAFDERERRWVEKQISLSSDRIFSPFGVYTVAYRFRIHGRVHGGMT